MSNNKIIPYFLCARLLLIVFLLQFVVTLFIKNCGGIFSNNLSMDYVYILLTQIVEVAIPCFLLCVGKKVGIKRTLRIKSVKIPVVIRCVALGFCLQPVAIIANVPLHSFAQSSNAIVSPPGSFSDIMLMT